MVDPVVRKRYVELPVPTRGDDAADLLRLERSHRAVPGSIWNCSVSCRADCGRPGFAARPSWPRAGCWTSSPATGEWDAYAGRGGPGHDHAGGLALGLANRGRDLGIVSQLNPQTRFGDDVLSQSCLPAAMARAGGSCRPVVAEAIDAMIGELCQQADIPGGRSTRSQLPATRPCSKCSAAWTPRRWARCLSCPAAGRSLTLSAAAAGAAAFIPAAGHGSCPSSADSSAATPWPACWPPG